MANGEGRRRWWIAFVAAGAFASGLSALAYAGRLSPILFAMDKPIHFTVAGVLAFTLDRATGARSLRWIAGLLAIFAIEEVMQRFSSIRSSSIADYAADVAGVTVFVAASRLLSKTRRAKPADDVAK